MTNPLREQMVANVIAQHPGEPIENLVQYLPPDFDFGPDDLERYQQADATEFGSEPAESTTTVRLSELSISDTPETEQPTASEFAEFGIRI